MFFLPSAGLTQEIIVTGIGKNTCGDVLSSSENDRYMSKRFTDWFQGFVTGANWIKEKKIGEGISPETLEQLWKAKCRESQNVTRYFLEIAMEFYKEQEAKRR